ncbi:DUF2202 domain-containing protein [Rhabdochromatium marinum]|uniref:DUF2202 domain-containing protein n=1 Tax=Rhabdochromatium marinum TaxID=48729 RepID=UPI0019031BA1|nr:DUF2202 domain-containing protein [Rhabdochromatium marinum]
MLTRPLLIASMLSTTLMTGSLWAGQGSGLRAGLAAGSGPGVGSFDPTTCPAAMPYEAVDAIEIEHVVFMREEEKLARDLYLVFAEQSGWPQFTNIAASEQQHMEAVKTLLEKYAIEDPILTDQAGVFTNPKLQGLYDTLLAAGQASATEAFRVAALVEEVDIADLDNALAETDNQDLTQLFNNLQRGSRNHLRAFVRTLESLTGAPYSAQQLTQERLDAILADGMERGGSGQGGQGRGQR